MACHTTGICMACVNHLW